MNKHLSAPSIFSNVGIFLGFILVVLFGAVAPLKFFQSMNGKVLDATLEPAFQACIKSKMDNLYYRIPVPKNQEEYKKEEAGLVKSLKEVRATCTTSVVTSTAQKAISFLFASAVILLSAASSIFNALKARPERLKNSSLCHLLDQLQVYAILSVIAMVIGCALAFAASLRFGNSISNVIPMTMVTLSVFAVYITCVITAALVALLGQAELPADTVAPGAEVAVDAQLNPSV